MKSCPLTLDWTTNKKMGDDRLLSTLICVENINVIPFEIVSF